jgi:hypothetical protein
MNTVVALTFTFGKNVIRNVVHDFFLSPVITVLPQ